LNFLDFLFLDFSSSRENGFLFSFTEKKVKGVVIQIFYGRFVRMHAFRFFNSSKKVVFFYVSSYVSNKVNGNTTNNTIRISLP
jgi:hypothetical protein